MAEVAANDPNVMLVSAESLMSAGKLREFITVGDHLITGGLGSAVSEVVMDEGLEVQIKRIGIPGDDFPPLGDMYELYKHLEFDLEGMYASHRLFWRASACPQLPPAFPF